MDGRCALIKLAYLVMTAVAVIAVADIPENADLVLGMVTPAGAAFYWPGIAPAAAQSTRRR